MNDQYEVNEDGSVSLKPAGQRQGAGWRPGVIVPDQWWLLTGGAQSIAVTNGTVVIAANGSNDLPPNENFNGDISFDYVARTQTAIPTRPRSASRWRPRTIRSMP